MQIQLYDTTLRDGTQGEGISLSCDDKLRIARRLDEFGMRYIDCLLDAQMVEQGNYVVGKRGEVQAGFVAERLGRAVAAAIEREQADAGPRCEGVGDLVDVAP